MKQCVAWLFLAAAGCCSLSARGQLRISCPTTDACSFGPGTTSLPVVCRNDDMRALDDRINVRIFQASSATAVLLKEFVWKRVEIQPAQTVLEIVPLSFPVVWGETIFIIQWLDESNSVLGTAQVAVYPTNLLTELRALAGIDGPGVFDPNNQIKPSLQALGVSFVDLEATEVRDFRGRLLLLGPFSSKTQMADELTDDVRSAVKAGAAVVWMMPPRDKRDKLEPSFYSVSHGRGSLIVMQASMTENLASSPRSQLNLLHCARLALRPEAPELPHTAER
jgi:hypothetical protein